MMLLPKKILLAIFIAFFLPFAISGCSLQGRNIVPKPGQFDITITTEELSSLLKQKNIVLVDARKKEEYKMAHIPGAVNINKEQFREPLNKILDFKRDNGFAIPPEMAEEMFGKAGIGSDTRVVIYDSVNFPDASIVWAILKYYGHDNMQILDGGIEKWLKDKLPYTTAATTYLPSQEKKFIAKPRPEMVASREWLLDNKDKVTILDMRSFEEYTGVDTAELSRGGHIPDALNIDWRHFAGNATVRLPKEIRKILDEAGISRNKEIVTYCNLGIGRSTYGFMVLRMLGYKARVYGGSFEDWTSVSELKVSTVN